MDGYACDMLGGNNRLGHMICLQDLTMYTTPSVEGQTIKLNTYLLPYIAHAHIKYYAYYVHTLALIALLCKTPEEKYTGLTRINVCIDESVAKVASHK